MAENNDFQPDWTSPPGDTLADILDERGLSRGEFARLIGWKPEHVEDLLQGRIRITTEVAQQLVAVVGASTAFWAARETQYRNDLTRLRDQEAVQWLRGLPLKDMIRFGWIKPAPKPELMETCLRFFDVPDLHNWQLSYRDVLSAAAFRTSATFESKDAAVAAWLRQGEIESASIDCKPWDAERFRQVLLSIRRLTRKKDPTYFIPELRKSCSVCGVAVVVLPAPAGCRASGATRFISPAKGLLLLSFRHLSDDHFWFTFFHEAGHLLLHKHSGVFLEGPSTAQTKEEEEANEFAARFLVPPEFQRGLLALGADPKKVIKFAKGIGISAGVVVGQLQHYRRIRRDQLNSLKRRFTWDKS
jgi:HTH-type transcriptional regulator / antitoxin HigA